MQGVLFDFGYTLFAHEPLRVTIATCARQLGAEMSDEHASSLAQRIDAAAMTPEELVHPRDLDATVWKQRWEFLYALADESLEGLGAAVNMAMHDPAEWIPYQRTGETLRALAEHGLSIGIVSNTGWDIRQAFEVHGASSSVASFTLSYEAGAMKPDPKIFAAACESLGLAPEQVVMVGDDPRADGGAAHAGIPTLLLPALPPHCDNGVAAVLDLVGIHD